MPSQTTEILILPSPAVDIETYLTESKTIVTRSAEETHDFGRAFASELLRGSCVGLIGDLGSGKTCLAKGICEGLGAKDLVTSPTFVLINEYSGVDGSGEALPIYHFDLYRLGGEEELLDIGCDDFFYGEGVCLIEWANFAGSLLPDEAYRVVIEATGQNTRELTVSGGKAR